MGPVDRAAPPCVVALCHREASGYCPQSHLLLCSLHLKRATGQVREQRSRVADHLIPIQRSLEWAVARERRLAADERELVEVCDQLEARVREWRDDVIGRKRRQLEETEQQNRAQNDIRRYRGAAKVVSNSKQWSRLFRLLLLVGPSIDFLEAMDLPGEVPQASLAAVQEACRDTQSSIRSQLVASGYTQQRSAKVGPPAPLDSLPARPWRIALCDNTTGYSFSAEQSRVTDTPPPGLPGWRPLPALCLIVCFHPDECADHLLLASPDADRSVEAKLRPAIRWRSQIYSLRCDNENQLLLLAQGRYGITVADLSGRVLRRVTAKSLGLPVLKTTGLGFNTDALFALNYNKRTIVVISRATWSVQRSLDASGFYSTDFFTESLSWCDGALLLTDWVGRVVRRVSPTTGRQLSSYPASDASIKGPYDVVSGSHGRLFVADPASHVVWALGPDGGLLGVLGRPDEPGEDEKQLSAPVSLALWEDPDDNDAAWVLVAGGGSAKIRSLRVDF